MRERIYTIPVSEAFSVECECPLCVLEKKLEDESVEYMLGPSLMEPDGRIETNEKGFCKRHFEKLYNKHENRLGLGLIIDTHLVEQNRKLEKAYKEGKTAFAKDSELSLIKNLTSKLTSSKTDSGAAIDNIISVLTDLEKKCAICTKLDHTMDRYIDVVLYLYFEEPDFNQLFKSKKGFCLKHLKDLLQGSRKYLSPKQAAIFTEELMSLQLDNLKRVQEEVNWFTKKFDYRNDSAPWGNSKDAIPRSIQKVVGHCEFK